MPMIDYIGRGQCPPGNATVDCLGGDAFTLGDHALAEAATGLRGRLKDFLECGDAVRQIGNAVGHRSFSRFFRGGAERPKKQKSSPHLDGVASDPARRKARCFVKETRAVVSDRPLATAYFVTHVIE
jgi:hypothetical protein